MIESAPADWRALQARVAAILNECGFNAAVAVQVQTARGAVEVDVHATDPTVVPPTVTYVECKHWATNVPQGEVQQFRTVVQDGGAHVGLFVSSQGFQAGAHRVVENTNVRLMTWTEFQDMFEERWIRHFWVPAIQAVGSPIATATEPLYTDAWTRQANGEHVEEWEAVGMFTNSAYSLNGIGVGPNDDLSVEIQDLCNEHAQHLPQAISQAQNLRELLQSIVTFCRAWNDEQARQRNQGAN